MRMVKSAASVTHQDLAVKVPLCVGPKGSLRRYTSAGRWIVPLESSHFGISRQGGRTELTGPPARRACTVE